MELNSVIPTEPPRDAATVVMVRDGPRGLQVFLVKRHGRSDVLGGAYVFPGGKLDATDCDINAQAHLDQSPAELHRALGEPALSHAHAAGLYVAAVREAFEESRVLFVHDNALWQQALVYPPDTPFNTLLRELNARLLTRNVHPWSRWITPRIPAVSAKRFDTRFFVVQAPTGQQAVHDNHELTESVWLEPRTALLQYRDQIIDLAPPQIMSLYHLSRHPDVASLIAEAGARVPPLVFPESFDLNGTRVLCYPGDPLHPVSQRALPGPTRLVYRHGRFEPQAGFDGLLT